MTMVNELQAKSFSGEFIGQKHRYGSLALGILAAVVAADSGVTVLEKQAASRQAELTSNSGQGEQAVVALPGCRTDGSYQADMFAPQLEYVGDSHFISYPKRGFALDSIKEKLLEARARSHDKPLAVLATSMGGMVIAQALKDPEFRQKFGFIDRLVLDSSPSDEQDVRSQARFAMGAAAVLQNSWTASTLSSRIMFNKARKRLSHETCVSDEQVNEHFFRTTHTPLHVASSQGEFIRETHFEPGELTGSVGEIVYIQSRYDTVINTDAAIAAYQQIYDQPVTKVVDSARPIGSHAAGPEYQSKVVELLDLQNELPSEPATGLVYRPYQPGVSAA